MVFRETFSLKLVTRIARRSVLDSFRDRLGLMAAAVAFFSVLSFFPLVIAVVSPAMFFVEQEQAINLIVSALQRILPGGEHLVRDTILEITSARQRLGIVASLVLLWTASKMFGALTMALNVIFDSPERYSFVKRTGLQLLMTLSFGVLFFLLLFASSAGALAASLFPVVFEQSLVQIIDFVGPPLLLFALFFALYRCVPNAGQTSRSAFWGAFIALLLFVAARPLFTTYLKRFAAYNILYGSLGIVAGLLVWSWLFSIITLFGAEVASHVFMMVDQGRDEEQVKALHPRRTHEASSTSLR